MANVTFTFPHNVIVSEITKATYTFVPAKGEAGRTPVKGVDYFTAQDIAEIVSEVTRSLAPVKTVSGNPVSVTDALALPAQALRVSIAPAQSGSGEPSPDNVREITGMSSVTVTGTAGSVTIPLGQTVYGGTVDVVNGSGVCDMAIGQMTYSYLSGLSSSYIGYASGISALGGANAIWVRNWNYQAMPARCAGGIRGVCNAFPVSIHDSNVIGSQNRVYFTVGSGITSVEDFLAAVQALENGGSGLYIAYELAEPTSFTVTAQAVALARGANTVSTDAESLTLTYCADLSA